MLNITDPAEARKIIRADKYDKQTAGIAGKYVQGNLCILPSKYALDLKMWPSDMLTSRALSTTQLFQLPIQQVA